MKNNENVDHVLFDDPAWKLAVMKKKKLKKLAQEQLGTIGSGNHYVHPGRRGGAQSHDDGRDGVHWSG